MGRMCKMHTEIRHVYKFSVRKPEGKKPLVIHKCRWEDNIKMDPQEIC
jgi:hypothetical protein